MRGFDGAVDIFLLVRKDGEVVVRRRRIMGI